MPQLPPVVSLGLEQVGVAATRITTTTVCGNPVRKSGLNGAYLVVIFHHVPALPSVVPPVFAARTCQ